MTREDWPFGSDADRSDPLTRLRIPVVGSFNPRWKYVAAYLKPVEEGAPGYMSGPPFGSNERPTGEEAEMLASFILRRPSGRSTRGRRAADRSPWSRSWIARTVSAAR